MTTDERAAKIVQKLVALCVYPARIAVNSNDRAAKVAEELLPCEWECYNTSIKNDHNEICPANFRPAVAAKLREAYGESERLKNDEVRRIEYEQELSKELDEKDAEITRLQEIDAIGLKSHDASMLERANMLTEIARLRAELASIEQFAEAWPCHCAENYPGTTEYHGHDCQTAIAQEFVAQWRAGKEKA